MAKAEKHQCAERVWHGYHKFPCQFAGRLFEGGKWWCKRHAPSTVEAKRDAQKAMRACERELYEAEDSLREARNRIADIVIGAYPSPVDGGALLEWAGQARRAEARRDELVPRLRSLKERKRP